MRKRKIKKEEFLKKIYKNHNKINKIKYNGYQI